MDYKSTWLRNDEICSYFPDFTEVTPDLRWCNYSADHTLVKQYIMTFKQRNPDILQFSPGSDGRDLKLGDIIYMYLLYSDHTLVKQYIMTFKQRNPDILQFSPGSDGRSRSGNLTNHHLALTISLILILSNGLVDCFEKTEVADVSG
ncbi:hypothetical protein llap_15535 [Limosa lapponica baueri]|uniref:Uncharacterized protein n=1 Tax=Limosa lapponica baueri TaxID=1758121 RepID=A0A2I0TK34_LIMLA|nr:hypothetical protein llap_15535 [Limosa lapponica baueri]